MYTEAQNKIKDDRKPSGGGAIWEAQ